MILLLQTGHFRILTTGIMIIGQFLHFTLSHCYDVVKAFLSGMIQGSDSKIFSSTSFAMSIFGRPREYSDTGLEGKPAGEN